MPLLFKVNIVAAGMEIPLWPSAVPLLLVLARKTLIIEAARSRQRGYYTYVEEADDAANKISQKENW